MKNECSIIRDLLPLYAENMVSPDTAEFVEEHLKGCEACREEYEKAKRIPASAGNIGYCAVIETWQEDESEENTDHCPDGCF